MAQLGNLIVTGTARFLNEIKGKLDWSNILNKPTTLSGYGITDGLSSTTKYAGSGSVGGSATSAEKLNTNAGSATNPVYFNSGIPTTCTYSLNKTVPSNAVFTDEKVTQTESTTDSNYEILLSGTASTATSTEGSLKSSGLRFNPSKKAIMEGIATTASGNNSHAEGQATYASTTCAHAEGVATSATGQYSHAEGAICIASGTYSHAEGSGSRATYDCAHAEGMGTTANGGCSHAEGGYTLASNGQDHAEGYKTTANGGYSHVEGTLTLSSGNASHAEGYGTVASSKYSHAEGQNTTASGDNSHAEGSRTIASAARTHAEGYMTSASATQSHAEGQGTLASGKFAHAEGQATVANSTCAHAEGQATTSSGMSSHSEGNSTLASGMYSHAEGYFTTASHKSQHVFGEYNLADASTAAATDRGDYVEIVGNGLSSTQLSNARTLDWDGNEWLAGSLVASSVSAVDSNSNTNTSISPTGLATYTIPSGSQAISTGLYTTSDDIVLYSGTVTNTWDGTNTSLKSAIGRLKDGMDFFTLINAEAVTSTATQKTLYSDRKFSDYSMLVFVAIDNQIRSSITFPSSMFSTLGNPASLTWVDSANTQYWIEVTYVSDTKISVKCKSGVSGKLLYVFGLMKK